MSSKASIKFVLKGLNGTISNGYLTKTTWGLNMNQDILEAALFNSREEAEAYSVDIVGEYEALRVSHMLTIDLVPELEKSDGYGTAVKGDLYPKHWDML